jgi:serralysin
MGILTGTSGNDSFVAHSATDYEKGQLVLVLGGIPAGGEWPKVGIMINGQWVTVATINSYIIDGHTQVVTVPLPAGPISSVGLQYFNDGVVGNEDRNLYVGSATLNGVDLPLSQGTYAIDGDATIAGQHEVYRNGILSWNGSVVANAMAQPLVAENQDITGGGGIDTVSYTGRLHPNFDFKYQADGSITVHSFSAGFTDTLHGIGNVLFDDTSAYGSGGVAVVDAANRIIDGGQGIDTLVLDGHTDMYHITHTTTGFSIFGNGVDEWVTNVERLQFTNGIVALDINGDAGQAYRLYQAAFNRVPDSGGLGYQTNALDTGLTLTQVAQNFINSPEFQSTYGNVDDTQFLTLLYRNVLHREPDSGGLQFHLDEMHVQGQSRAMELVHFSESPENQANVIGAIQDGMFMLNPGS